MPARRPARRPRRKARKAVRKARVPRTINPNNQNATSIETVDVRSIDPNTIYFNTFSLANFPRSSQISLNYKWYKAEYVEWEYTPLFTNYQADNAETNVSVPYMFQVMNRTQDAQQPADPTLRKQFMQSQGAIPQKFTKKIVIRYKPNWCSPGVTTFLRNSITQDLIQTASAGLTTNNGWLVAPGTLGQPGNVPETQLVINGEGQASYNNSINFTTATQYNGHTIYIDQENTGSDTVKGVCDLVCRVKWVFKGPAPFYKVLRDPAQNKEVLPL